MTPLEPREFLTRVFRDAVAAADPRAVTRQAVAALEDLPRPVWVVSVGKGAHGMASGAVEALHHREAPLAGGLVIAHEPDPSATHRLETIEGDHPTPGQKSLAAANRLGDVAAGMTGDADVLVLVSGGATSLIAAPMPPISGDDLRQAFSALLASGADIGLMNAIRKRLLRFGAGRLALAMGARRIHCLIASDVIGNDPSSIASGPCVADHSTAAETRESAIAASAWDVLPRAVREQLEAMAEGRVPDVPPADHPRFATTTVRVILDRTHAERGAADAAGQLGANVEVLPSPLSGEAAAAGRQFATRLLDRPRQGPDCIIWTGETTVTLGSASGRGGRCQEFALAAAMRLDEAGPAQSNSITILAAGTDGRDGPTDAAGAVADGATCARIREQGIDPAAALQDHDSFRALNAAGSLLRTGATGTNVNDLVIGLIP